MSRFWPLWAVYTVIWFFLLPLNLFSEGASLAERYAKLGLTGWAGDTALGVVCNRVGVIAALIYGAVCAMAVWSYLYNNRAANMTHALPVRREGHFAAHFLSGVSFFLLPHVLIFIITAAAGAMKGSTGDLGSIAAAMGIETLLCLFFFCFATLCAFVTGHILALPVLYGIANFLVYGVTSLVHTIFSQFLFGFGSSLRVTREYVMWLTPFANLTSELKFAYTRELNDTTSEYALSIYGIAMPENHAESYTITRQIEGLDVVFIYAAVGVVFAVLALLLYRRRHLETAGDVVAVPWMRPVFQYGVAFCAALAGCYVTADILGQGGPAMLTALLVLWGVIGYFAARMLLHKSLKVFKFGWKGAAATAGVLLVLCGVLWTDVLGIESRLPDASQVGAVYISGPDSNPGDSGYFPSVMFDDQAQIEQILNIHRTIVEHKAELKSAAGSGSPDTPDQTTSTLKITYYETGSDIVPLMERQYNRLVLSAEDLDDPNSLAYALNAYLNDPAVIRAAYELDEVEPGRMTTVQINGLCRDDGDGGVNVDYVTLYSPLSDYALAQSGEKPSGNTALPGDLPMAESADDPTRSEDGHQPAAMEELGELWDAVLADFDEGNLGRRWLFQSDDFDENTSTASLEFFYQTKVDRPGQEDYYWEDVVTIQLTPQARHTLAAMEQLGLFEDGYYVTTRNDQRMYPR